MRLKDELQRLPKLKEMFNDKKEVYDLFKITVDKNSTVLNKLNEGEMTLDNYRWLIAEVLRGYDKQKQLWEQLMCVTEDYITLAEEISKRAVER